MAKISLIQVGDVHYPDWDISPYQTDHKDKRMGRAIAAGLTFVPLRRILEWLSRRSNDPNLASIIFMGDFTSKGLPHPLFAALNHFSWLCKAIRKREARPKLLLVPGNHDVGKSDALDLGQFGKFDKITKWAEQTLWYPPPIEDPIHVPLHGATGEVAHVFLINTTLGSWERYLLPPALHEALDNDSVNSMIHPDPSRLQIDVAGVPHVPAPAENYYDQLDTPYVSAKCLDKLSDVVERLPKKDAIIVVGHHNILPQEQPRVASYADLLNAGFMRRRLLQLKRPIIYLHGHTHVDLIEQITDPRNSNAKIVAVCAPKLEMGFNEISIHFDARRSALGVRVLPYRLPAGGTRFGADTDNQVASSLQATVALQPSPEARAVVDKLTFGGRFNVVEIEEKAADLNIPSLSIESVLLELFFWRWIDIDQVGRDMSEWRINVQVRSS